MNLIKSFEEACNKLSYDTTLPDVSGLPVKHQKAIIAHYKLVIITEALNDGHEHDWTNPCEWKYYPLFNMEGSADLASSGLLLVYDGYDYDSTGSTVGSRLCFKSTELAKYAAKQFADLYADYFLINNTELAEGDGTELKFNNTRLSMSIKQKISTMGNPSLRTVAPIIGISTPTLSRVLKKHDPDIKSFAKIIAWLQMPADYFFDK